MIPRHFAAPLLISACLGGCASITGEFIGNDIARNKEADGIRYFLPAPYVMVSQAVPVDTTETLYQEIGGSLCELTGPCGTTDREEAQSGGSDKLGAGNDDKGGGSGSAPKPTNTPGQGDSAPAKPTPKPAADAEALKDAISILWLPDPCHLYSVRVKTVLGTQKANLTLADGWRLEAFETDQDTTDVAEKFLDLAGIFITAQKDIKVAAAGGEAAEGEADGGEQDGGEEEAQSGEESLRPEPARVLWRKVTSISVKPGVYPLFARSGADCAEMPAFARPFDDTAFATSVRWERIDPAPNGK
jgi:hypothetical protein